MLAENQSRLAELERQNAELQRQVAELQSSHRLLQAVVEGTTDAVFVKDLRGRYLMANTAVTCFVGKPVEEILGNDDTRLFSAETARQIMDRDRGIMESGQTQTDEEVSTAAGQTRTYLSIKGPYLDDRGHVIGLIGISRDITERKQAEIQFHTSEARFATVFRSSPIGICITTLEEGTFLDANPAFLRTENLTLESILGRTSLELGYWRDPQERRKVVQHLQETGSIINWEMSHRLKDGTINHSLRSLERITLDGQDCIVTMLTDITDRKAVEQTLAASEKRFRALVENSTDVILMVAIDGTIQYVSPAEQRIFGYEPEESIGINGFDRVHPDDLPRARETFASILAVPDRPLRVEIRMRHKDGSWRWIEGTGTNRLDDPAVRAVIANFRDITERRRTEQFLRESEERYRSLVDYAPTGIFVNVDDKFAYVNDAFCRLVGATSQDQLLGQPVFERFHPDFHAVIRQRIQRVKVDREPVPAMKQRYLRLDGAVVSVETAAIPIHFQGHSAAQVVVNDITERLRAEEALHVSEARFRAIVEHGGDAFFMMDANGTVTFGSPATAHNLGYSEQEFAGRNAFEFIHPDDQTTLRGLFARLLQEPSSDVRCQLQALHRNGSWLWLDAISCNRLADPKLQSIVVSYRDITDRKRIEESLSNALDFNRQIIESAEEGIVVYDREQRYVVWNPFMERLSGVLAADVLGRHPDEVFPFLRTTGLIANLERALAGETMTTPDMPFTVPQSGRSGWSAAHHTPLRSVTGEIIGVISTVHDVTKRRQNEEALRESHERFQLVAKATNDAVWDWNLNSDIGWWNDGVYALFGYQREQMPAETILWKEHLHPEDRDRVLQGIQSTIDGGGQSWSDEYRIVRADGSVGVVFDRGFTLRDASGKAIRMIGAAQDITARKRTEEGLRESEGRLRLLMQASNVGLWDWNVITNDVYFSPEWKQQLGYSIEEVPGHFEEWRTRVHPEDLARTLAAISDFLAGGHDDYDAEFRMRHKDGSWRWIMTRADLIHDADGQPIRMMGCHVDITDRKQAEIELRQSRSFLEKAQHLANLGTWVCGPAPNDPLWWSEQTYEIFGISPGQFDGRVENFFEMVHPDDRLAVQTASRLAHAGEQPYDLEHRILRPDGSVRWVHELADIVRDADGQVMQMIGVVQDITHRKQAEEALAVERLLLRTMADHLPASVFVKDTVGRFVFANRTHAQQLGLNSEAEMLGKTVFDFFPDDIAQLFDADSKSVIQTGTPVIEREEPYEAKGKCGWFLTTKVPLRDAQGTITGLVGVALDITARKQAEAALIDERNLLRTLVDHIPDLIFVKDIQSRQLLNNAANLCLLGAQTDAEVVGKTVFDFYPREQAQRYFDEDQAVMRSGQAQINQEESVLNQEGEERWLLGSKLPLRDVHGTCIGLVGIKRDITEHRRANSELTASRERLQVLSRQLIATQESERRHLARELHDEIGQALTGIKLNLKAMQQPVPPVRSSTLMQETIALVDLTLQQVRNLALDLRPSMLDEIGLVAALRWCLDRQARQAGFTLSFANEASDDRIPPDVAIACFRVAQESLTNIARHAQARNVRVELHQREAELELLVHDDGRGFDVAAAHDRAARGDSVGLLGMEERMQLLGGQIEIHSAPSAGTTIRARFPLRDSSSVTEERS